MYVGVGLYYETNSLYTAVSEDEWKKCVGRQVSCSFDAVIKIQMPLICILKTFCSFLNSWHGLILKIAPFFFCCADKVNLQEWNCLLYTMRPMSHFCAGVFCTGVSVTMRWCLWLLTGSLALRGMFHTRQKPKESLNKYLFKEKYAHTAKFVNRFVQVIVFYLLIVTSFI